MNSKHVLKLGVILWAWIGLNAPARAATIFSDNFQDGSYSNWTMRGNGYDAANLYYGNYSMRIDGTRQGVIAASTQGYQNVTLSVKLAALYLTYGDYCYAEYSTNGGSTWNTLTYITDGGDDGLFRTASASSGLDNNPNVQLRFRAYNWYYHYCYGDDVSLTGTPIGGGDGAGD